MPIVASGRRRGRVPQSGRRLLRARRIGYRKKAVVSNRAKGYLGAIRKAPHMFVRGFDWANLYALQGSTFDGSYGLDGLFAGCVASFSGNYLALTVPGATAGFASFAISPMLRSMPDFNEFTSLFDMYKMTGYSLKIVGLYNDYQATVATGGALSTVGQTMPVIHWVHDDDDNSPLSAAQNGIDAMREYTSYKWRGISGNNIMKTYKSRLGVRLINEAGQTGSGTTRVATIKTSPKLDCAAADIQHHGVKVIFELVNSLNTMVSVTYLFKIECRAYLKLYEVR